MNCLMVCQSRMWVATIVFYTCIWIPLQQLKSILQRLVGFIFFFSYDSTGRAMAMELLEAPLLPATRYQDLLSHSCVGEEGKVEETCSICLVEFEGEDAVSKFGRCGHVFHLNCIQRWLDQNNFTCPLCRSSLFSQHRFRVCRD
ncbi:hypothetical protein L6164_026143 [Bauhinia variegata]|uniref:Uncharacterized protein n=1 Tax=Bauhinia variegata TaxID=167791 RepID=A0ACB9LP48_BAUVA|nr:hypothetical protein L6164_026143 [Bauhinia variegata]